MAETPGPSGEGSRFRLRESAFEVLVAAIDCQDDSDIIIEETEAESDGSDDLVSDSDSHDGSDSSDDETQTQSAADSSTTAEEWRPIQPLEAMRNGTRRGRERAGGLKNAAVVSGRVMESRTESER